MRRARAILVDLDDTIVRFDADADAAWREVCSWYAPDLDGPDEAALFDAIARAREWYWADPDRHAAGRADLLAASTLIVVMALDELGAGDATIAASIARDYRALRNERLVLVDGAVEALTTLRAEGVRIGLVTNGAQVDQRAKITRFDLAPLFDAIWIEGERGAGKPNPAVYLAVCEELGAPPSDVWSVGDNLEWDVVVPQQLGAAGIWVNAAGTAPDRSDTPDAVIASLAELPALWCAADA